ncbi:glycosyl transferase family 1 [Hyphomicrobium methylovorum]|uniref:ABC-F family ATP-binding cassette domain-containing protein n=1 Tax=Hyphomicrobium methylovorum TaxID=84 RepID=UPI0015E7E53B|nr:ABC-F family ATP-binding cassette domain-containing protein [Hyphomicrobium methylovorum]MBA2125793.1 glycosyl transferase family 1 [Hyphomicrobium methylovorum]
MLHINDLTYRIEGRPILEGATVAIPSGHKVGLVGRNGAGKTTLLRLLKDEIAPDDGTISIPRNARIGHVAQEAPGGDDSLIEWVLSADTERAQLLAEAEHAHDPERIAEIQLRLTDIDAHSAPARAARILSGLGFDDAAQQRACREFSGGWRMRVALGAVLFLKPDILLLDEPTNYLDLEGTLWLESHLKAYPHTVLIVSHDRDLLNRAVGAILHLDKGKLTLYAGGYDDFEETRREKQRLELKLMKKQDEQRRHLQAFIDRFKAKASKAAQAQSRVKALAKMQPIAAQVDDRVVPFHFPDPQKTIASPLLRIEKASAGYEPGRAILNGIDLRIDNDDRIALLGQNGNGKSTLAKLIAGRLAPLTGNLFGAQKVDVGYFAQHQLDDLSPNSTPYDYIVKLMPDATEAQRRTRLGTFGFGAAKADTVCKNLSGGEKARLLLAITAFHGPHLLILDEPTNHLDVDSREALVRALLEYNGAVILISHDRHLIEATADRLWIVRDGAVSSYDGDIDSYRTLLLEERGGRNSERRDDRTNVDDRASRADQRRAAAERRAELAPLKKTMVVAEQRVDTLAKKIAKLDAVLADAELYTSDPQRAQKAALERGQLSRDLAAAEDEWLSATDAYESASAAVDA